MTAILIGCIALPTTTRAQVDIPSGPIAAITACFNDAINAKRIKKSGTNVEFICAGIAAKNFYDTIGGSPKNVKMSGYSAQRRFIYYEDDACYHFYADNFGKSVNLFQCFMNYDAGDFINK